GQEGKGFVLAETNKAAETVIQAFRGLKANFIAQEYLHDPKMKDLRCIVLGTKVLGAVEISPQIDPHNLDHPHQVKAIELKPTERKLVIKAAKVLGLKFAGLHLLRTKHGTHVLDVHSAPSLKLLESITGED